MWPSSAVEEKQEAEARFTQIEDRFSKVEDTMGEMKDMMKTLLKEFKSWSAIDL